MIEAIQRNVTWRAIPIAGIVGGTVFLLINMIFNPLLYGIDAFFILRYFGSLVLGTDALMDSSPLVLVVGALVHYFLSILFTLFIAILVHRWGLLVGIIGGGLIGLGIYLINFYTMTILFEWMFAINNTLIVISHIAFGAVAGGIYEMMDSYDEEFMEDSA
ncbi:MAG: hypothetical protein Phog2KO_34040 [Phototrophicaceae bacterium]